MKHISTNGIAAAAYPGSHRDECLLEALQLSIEKREVVMLTHNDKTYRVDWRHVVRYLNEQAL